MEHKITIRLSDKEYYLLEFMSKHYNNNKSKTIRELISNYADLVRYITPTRKIMEEYNQIKDELPFT